MRREELINKVISGNASEAEKKKFQLWLSQSEDNQKMYDQQLLVWQFLGSAKKEVDVDVDVDAAWMKFAELKDQIEDRPSKIIYKIAAVLIVLLTTGSIGIYLFFGNQQSTFSTIAKVIVPKEKMRTQENGTSQNSPQLAEEFVKPIQFKKKQKRKESNQAYVEYVLIDSSTVKLTNNSALKFLDYSSNNSRVASLIGAGVFDIKPSNQLFILETEDIIVHVEGTKFDISSPTPESHFVEIFVEEGSMDVFDKQNLDNKISLTSGQKYTFNTTTRVFEQVTNGTSSGSKWKRFWKKFGKKNKKN